MVAINFPDSPTNGQEHSGYVWDATNNVWNRLPTLPALDLIKFSAVAPSNPQDGQFWFDTTVGKMYVYYNDGSSSQWVSAIGGLASQTGTTGQVLTYDGTEWVADDLPASGKILQVVQTVKTDVYTVSLANDQSDSQDIPGYTATITPSSASNKILAMYTPTLYGSNGVYEARRDGSVLTSFIGDAAGNRTQSTSQYPIILLDSPATTSAVTYSARIIASNAGGATVMGVNFSYSNDDNQPYTSRMISTLTLMEVAG